MLAWSCSSLLVSQNIIKEISGKPYSRAYTYKKRKIKYLTTQATRRKIGLDWLPLWRECTFIRPLRSDATLDNWCYWTVSPSSLRARRTGDNLAGTIHVLGGAVRIRWGRRGDASPRRLVAMFCARPVSCSLTAGITSDKWRGVVYGWVLVSGLALVMNLIQVIVLFCWVRCRSPPSCRRRFRRLRGVMLYLYLVLIAYFVLILSLFLLTVLSHSTPKKLKVIRKIPSQLNQLETLGE